MAFLTDPRGNRRTVVRTLGHSCMPRTTSFRLVEGLYNFPIGRMPMVRWSSTGSSRSTHLKQRNAIDGLQAAGLHDGRASDDDVMNVFEWTSRSAIV